VLSFVMQHLQYAFSSLPFTRQKSGSFPVFGATQ
jgi:hypothetical protein